MRLKNTSRYPHDQVRELVEFGMRGVNTSGVQVNVKNCSDACRGRAYSKVPSMSPASTLKSVVYLITLGIGPPDRFPSDNRVKRWQWRWAEPDEECDPKRMRLHACIDGGAVRMAHQVCELIDVGHSYGGKRSPLIVLQNWQEALVAVAAHEARHIHQYRHAKPRAEVDCERFAAKRLAEFRRKGMNGEATDDES